MKSARVLAVVGMFLVALSTYGGVYWYASRVIDKIPPMHLVSGISEDAPDFQPIDARTFAAYQKIKATPGCWWANDFFSLGKWATAYEPRPVAIEGGPYFRSLPGFAFRDFPNEKIPDAAVPFGLQFEKSTVTDADLPKLRHLKSLECLDLSHTQVTDAGLRTLTAFEKLAELHLHGTKVTDAGVSELQKTLPKRKILRW